jgi:two-component system, OmpR family, alkaline phosphatase synthesis response regulator PhoP
MKTVKQKILVVDDEPHIVNLIRLTLSGEKYEVFSAYSGNEALNLAKQIVPDLIILDLMMPNVDGYQVCEELRKDAKTMNTPIMILSAKSQLVDKFKSINVGADDYMVKPFDPEELVKRVRVNMN